MSAPELVIELENRGYSYVVITEDTEDFAALTAVEPSGYQIEIELVGDMAVDRKVGARLWDIMFIGEESYL